MRKHITFLMIYWFKWIIFFLGARLLFLLCNWSETKAGGFSEALGSMWYGARMDMSMAAYLTMPVGLILALSIFFTFLRNYKWIYIYSAILLVLLIWIISIDIGLFQAWKYRIDASFLKYLATPREAIASMSHLPIFWIALGLITVSVFACLLLKRSIKKSVQHLAYPLPWWSAFIILLMTVVMIIPMRGGFQLAPMNQSAVYFSHHHFNNLAAINAPWNFMHDIMHQKKNKNPYNYFKPEEAEQYVSGVFPKAQYIPAESNEKPNVILIVWESLSSKLLDHSFDGRPVIPRFQQLMKEGTYFSNMYSTGNRTDKGIVGILSGYPAQPTESIIKIPKKAASLPMISRDLANNGYFNSFVYGGELEFANMKAYLMQGQFHSFTDIHDFPKKDHNSKWGAHDGVVMEKLKSTIGSYPSPFFLTWLTLSSHEPFETPTSPVMNISTDEGKFMNVFHYSDSIVYEFVRFCQQQPWWSNTILMITGDHGHPIPQKKYRSEDFHVPFLILGKGVERDTIIPRKVSQTDIAATILYHLGYDATPYQWSRNIFNSNVDNAYFTFQDGFGWAHMNGVFLFDNVGKRMIEESAATPQTILDTAKAVQQMTYQDFLTR